MSKFYKEVSLAATELNETSEVENPNYFDEALFKLAQSIINKLGSRLMVSGKLNSKRLKQLGVINDSFSGHLSPAIAYMESIGSQNSTLSQEFKSKEEQLSELRDKFQKAESDLVERTQVLIRDELIVTELNEMSAKLAGEEDRLKRVETQISELTSQADALKAQIEQLKTSVDTLKTSQDEQTDLKISRTSETLIESIRVLGSVSEDIEGLSRQAYENLNIHFQSNQMAVEAMAALSKQSIKALPAAIQISLELDNLLTEFDSNLKACINEQDETRLADRGRISSN